MRFTVIPQNTFEGMQLNAGVLLKRFDPETGAAPKDEDIICATTGGFTITCKPTYTDLGEDVDNCPKNMKELKSLESWECGISTTSLGTSVESIRLSLGAADATAPEGKVAPRALDVMCELTPYINNITGDPDVVSTIGQVVKPDGKINKYGLSMMFIDRIFAATPHLLKTHRTDVYGILSILNEKDAAEIAAQPIMETISQVRAIFQDKELLTFFKSSTRRGRNGQSAPLVFGVTGKAYNVQINNKGGFATG